MTESTLASQFPRKQIKPYDGMSITADVWTEAHEEHRQTLSAHTSTLHGAGIITGLDVIANDPPGQVVFISAGVAVDQMGHVIVVPDTVSYDFGSSADGTLYLMLGYGERQIGEENSEPCYIQAEYVIAARPVLKQPAVELARITISRAQKTIQNAENHLHPALNQLDLRFRQQINAQPQSVFRVAICHLGDKDKGIIQGWDHLINAYQPLAQQKFIVDTDVPFSENLTKYDLVYLGCNGAFKMEPAALQALKQCVSAKTPIMLEALDDKSEAACSNLLTELEQVVKPLKESHAALSSPHLFTKIPAGSRGTDIHLSANLIYSTAGYSLAWKGQIAGSDGSRTDIRDAHEFGMNLIHYLSQRRR